MKIPYEFLCNMCNLFKIKTESCVMLLLHHAAGHIIFLIDDAHCVGKRVGGSGTGKDACGVDQFLYSAPFISVARSVFFPR